MKTFNSNGKLLISGEYLVLDGAKALAIPTKYGQSLSIETINTPKLIWISIDNKGNTWFEDSFQLDEINPLFVSRNPISDRLIEILTEAKNLNPSFLSDGIGLKITTILEFPKLWGLGTSSTLINNIAQWANINPYVLLNKTFGGSGYDIACAQNNTPITYQIKNKAPITSITNFNPHFKDHLYFVYLNKKQNSREGIAHYKAHRGTFKNAISEINLITSQMISCNHLEDFNKLIVNHEEIIAQVTQQTPVKNLLFNDFNGEMKSLGAWGGDFILATSKTNPKNYFYNQGFDTVVPYSEMIL